MTDFKNPTFPDYLKHLAACLTVLRTQYTICSIPAILTISRTFKKFKRLGKTILGDTCSYSCRLE